MTITFAELLKDSAYKLTQFNPEQIRQLETTISIRDAFKKPTAYINCLVRGKPIKLTYGPMAKRYRITTAKTPTTLKTFRPFHPPEKSCLTF